MLAGSRDPEATTAVALCTAGTLAIPVAALRWELEAEALPYLAASSALQLAYFALLAGAYRRADLSVVYPLARGSAPVLVLGLAALVTGAATSGRQAVGVALVGAGVLLVRGLRRGRGVGIGLLIGAVIATYTVIDKEGIEHASPLAYVTVITIVPGLAYTGALIAARGARALRPARARARRARARRRRATRAPPRPRAGRAPAGARAPPARRSARRCTRAPARS